MPAKKTSKKSGKKSAKKATGKKKSSRAKNPKTATKKPKSKKRVKKPRFEDSILEIDEEIKKEGTSGICQHCRGWTFQMSHKYSEYTYIKNGTCTTPPSL